MRLYSFVNALYLKNIQHGLQTAHCVAEMYNKYPDDAPNGDCPRYNLLNDWARNHKTIVILDGGDCADLHDIVAFLKKHDRKLEFPYSYFCEDKRSLNGAITSVAVVVPVSIYDVKVSGGSTDGFGLTTNFYELDGVNFKFPTPFHEAFYELLKSKHLAR